MSSSPKAGRQPVARLRLAADLEVYKPEFVLFKSLASLDRTILEKAARAEFEVGYLKSSCCSQIVRATVRKGMVTALTSHSVSDNKPEPVSAELTRLLNSVQRKFDRSLKRSPRLPVSVADFLDDPVKMTTGDVHCWGVCYMSQCVVICQSLDTGLWQCSAKGFIVKP